MYLTGIDLSIIICVVAAVQWMVSKWFEARLVQSIKHEYDKRMEELRFETRKREQAARVSELLASEFSADPETERFNRLAWELSLWLPADIVRELTRYLCKDDTAKHPKEILIAIRRLLHGDKDMLEPEMIVHRATGT